MDTETLQLIAEFLSRVDLKGAEVQAFNKVMTALTSMAEANNLQAAPENIPDTEE
jgi:hypothetical protein|tara:strand:- start:495 stop:659 length:165 start_codon:yes stop_codon:yes gene_type:complete